MPAFPKLFWAALEVAVVASKNVSAKVNISADRCKRLNYDVQEVAVDSEVSSSEVKLVTALVSITLSIID